MMLRGGRKLTTPKSKLGGVSQLPAFDAAAVQERLAMGNKPTMDRTASEPDVGAWLREVESSRVQEERAMSTGAGDVEGALLSAIPATPRPVDREWDVRSTASRRSTASTDRASQASEARRARLLAEKKAEQLRRAQARKLQEYQLRLQNEAAEAEDAAELARIVEDDLIGEVSALTGAGEPGNLPIASAALAAATITRPVADQPSVTAGTRNASDLPEAEEAQAPSTSESRRLGPPATASVAPRAAVTRARSGVVVEAQPNSTSTPLTLLPAPADQGCRLNVDAPAWQPTVTNSANASRGLNESVQGVADLMAQVTASADAITARMTLPPLEVSRFSGEPTEYARFRHRFSQLVDSQGLSDSQKMTRLLQFVDGEAKSAIAGLEGLPGALSRALKILERRFGQPHIIVNACVQSLISGAPIARSDSEGLRRLADRALALKETLSALDAMGEMNTANMLKIIGRLPVGEQAKWRDEAQRLRERGQLPDFVSLVSFIERRAEAACDPVFGRLQTADKKPQQQRSATANQSRGHESQRVTTLTTQLSKQVGRAKCVACGKPADHKADACPALKSKSPRQRKSLAMELKLCLNCLKPGHFVAACKSNACCKTCGERHHTMLHIAPAERSGQRTDMSSKASSSEPHAEEPREEVGSYGAACQPTGSSAKVALHVVPVRVTGCDHTITTYALLDSGSEATFVTQALADRLNLKPKADRPVAICTLTGESVIQAQRVSLQLEPADSKSRNDVVVVPDVKIIADLNISRPRSIDPARWSHLQGINLVDVPGENVNLIIGADVQEAQLHTECRLGRRGEPYAVKTLFGWAVMGPLGTNGGSNMISVNCLQYCSEQRLEHQMEQFLDLDGMGCVHGPTKAPSVEDRRALEMLEHSTRLVDGHYEVGMLWRQPKSALLSNQAMAEARLIGLERKLRRNVNLHQEYSRCMQKLIASGYATEVNTVDEEHHGRRVWYLPHHAVVHPRKGKVRVVFDAAAKHNGVSLNSQLLQGPDLTNSLVGALLRFREYPVAVMADIEAMFMQVRVPAEDTDALRFLWWPGGDLNAKPATFKMQSHIFGATDSPSCANFALKKTAEDNKGDFSEEAVTAVKRDFYVDDLLKSVATTRQAIELVQELIALTARGGFRLTKWVSNDRSVLTSVNPEERARPEVDLDLDSLPVERALGVVWDVEADVFAFKMADLERPMTKRGVLSTISSLFDPLGFVSPVILKGKTLMQRLWKKHMSWDEDLPAEELEEWLAWRNELHHLAILKFPRWFLSGSGDIAEVLEVSLHIFCDASEEGYGMCAYLRHVYDDNSVSCCLALARSRVAPNRITTVPRLELQSALLSTRIYNTTLKCELTVDLDKIVMWSDSQTALQFINNEARRFHSFVAHRVAEIRESTDPGQWRHCPGKLNPADNASRGAMPEKFATQAASGWCGGPAFLYMSEKNWPPTEVEQIPDTCSELKIEVVSMSTRIQDATAAFTEMFARYSSWSRLQRGVAWLVRFAQWIRGGRQCRQSGQLSLEELKAATKIIVATIQAVPYAAEIASAKRGRQMPPSSPLLSLKPILRDGVLCVGGRLDKASLLSEDARHPVIIPKGHVAKLVAEHHHRRLAHAGREQTLADIRERFWIVAGRATVKDVVRHCITCRKANARLLEQQTAPLPTSRVTAYQPPFFSTGVDYFGPLLIKWGRGMAKRWGCLFTCLSTRAVHLEVAPSLSTDDFIMVLRQFINRRGAPREIRSDHGTNFVGANRELREALEEWSQDQIVAELQQCGIRWVFHPPAAPHMSGVWERLIGTAKKHLKAIVGNGLVTEFVLRTLFTEVEMIMNSRPITPVSDDPNDLEALTPNHFLLHRGVVVLPPGLFAEQDQYRRRWRQAQYLANLYWKRWLREYLPSLQGRQRQRTARRNVREGDLVLVVEPDTPRGKWKLARVVAAYQGSDGLVRSAEVKTASGSLHRPVTKLCLLEAA